ncbi:MAG: M20/M25/M40 family metallo-hydrolase, partial [Polyangiaceae bacterium]
MAVRAVLVALVLATVALLGVAAVGPPAPAPASARATDFSAERAMRELSVIAAIPHPTGTLAADAVRAHVVARLDGLGFAVEVQDTTSLTDTYAQRHGLPVVAAHVRNVVARKAGTGEGPVLLLTAHYDSRELSPGASDDGYGVAALLETARALSASGPLRHDVVLLVTEGEEQGLLGARAFVDEDPVAKEVALVLNFEARGDRGPVTMFQTSDGAGPLIDVMATAMPHVMASSLSQEVYRRMPNDTDLSVWLHAGYQGLNFANVDGVGRYHEPTDSLANADRGTLQQHGSYALALARAFANRDELAPARDQDEVYFSLPTGFVHYATREAPTFSWFSLGLLGIAAVVGTWRRRFQAASLFGGAVRAVAAVIIAGVVGECAWWAESRAGGGALAMQVARADLSTACNAGMVALGAGVAWVVMTARVRREEDVAVGATLPWALLAVASARWLAGGSYLFVWPVVAAGAAWCARVAARSLAGSHPAAIIAHLLATVLALNLLVPLALQLGVVFGPRAAPAIAALGAFAMTAAVPAMQTVGRPKPWVPAAALVAGGVGALVTAVALPPFDANAPRPDSLLYAFDADKGTAAWISRDARPDAWTGHALAGYHTAKLAELFPRAAGDVIEAPAPEVEIETPRIGILEDTKAGATRTLRLRVTLPSGTEIAGLEVPPDAHVTSAKVQGKAFGPEAKDGWLDLAFFGPPGTGLELDMDSDANAPLMLRIVAQTRGLPPSLLAP